MNARLAVLSVVVILLALVATFIPAQRAHASVVTEPAHFDGTQLQYAPAAAAWLHNPTPIVWADSHRRPHRPDGADATGAHNKEIAVAQPGRPASVSVDAALDYAAALRLYHQSEIDYARHADAHGHEE